MCYGLCFVYVILDIFVAEFRTAAFLTYDIFTELSWETVWRLAVIM